MLGCSQGIRTDNETQPQLPLPFAFYINVSTAKSIQGADNIYQQHPNMLKE